VEGYFCAADFCNGWPMTSQCPGYLRVLTKLLTLTVTLKHVTNTGLKGQENFVSWPGAHGHGLGKILSLDCCAVVAELATSQLCQLENKEEQAQPLAMSTDCMMLAGHQSSCSSGVLNLVEPI